MKVLISGSTGLIGSALIRFLRMKNHQPVRLLRQSHKTLGSSLSNEPYVLWDIEKGSLNVDHLGDIDAVVHLAGESIGGKRWSPEQKRRILESRTRGTRLIAESLAKMTNPPKTLISVSAIGFYGDRGNEWLTEVSESGTGFLAEVCRAWEAAAQPARDKGIRVVHPRFGLVLSRHGGALQAMYWPFRLGLAGNLGNGRQFMSWISLEDTCRALVHLLEHPEIHGPVNVVSPEPVTNARFTDEMRQALISPLLPMRYWTPPLPALAIRLLMGEMGVSLLLSSTRVNPVRLLESGFQFSHPALRGALESALSQ